MHLYVVAQFQNTRCWSLPGLHCISVRSSLNPVLLLDSCEPKSVSSCILPLYELNTSHSTMCSWITTLRFISIWTIESSASPSNGEWIVSNWLSIISYNSAYCRRSVTFFLFEERVNPHLRQISVSLCLHQICTVLACSMRILVKSLQDYSCSYQRRLWQVADQPDCNTMKLIDQLSWSLSCLQIYIKDKC